MSLPPKKPNHRQYRDTRPQKETPLTPGSVTRQTSVALDHSLQSPAEHRPSRYMLIQLNYRPVTPAFQAKNPNLHIPVAPGEISAPKRPTAYPVFLNLRRGDLASSNRLIPS